jgi:hypothetical protein
MDVACLRWAHLPFNGEFCIVAGWEERAPWEDSPFRVAPHVQHAESHDDE